MNEIPVKISFERVQTRSGQWKPCVIVEYRDANGATVKREVYSTQSNSEPISLHKMVDQMFVGSLVAQAFREWEASHPAQKPSEEVSVKSDA